jgi:hypothetical protein
MCINKFQATDSHVMHCHIKPRFRSSTQYVRHYFGREYRNSTINESHSAGRREREQVQFPRRSALFVLNQEWDCRLQILDATFLPQADFAELQTKHKLKFSQSMHLDTLRFILEPAKLSPIHVALHKVMQITCWLQRSTYSRLCIYLIKHYGMKNWGLVYLVPLSWPWHWTESGSVSCPWHPFHERLGSIANSHNCHSTK